MSLTGTTAKMNEIKLLHEKYEEAKLAEEEAERYAKDANVIKDKILNSLLYAQGDSFTVSDMCGRIQHPAYHVRKVLDQLCEEHKVTVDIRSEANVYKRRGISNEMLTKRFANYDPPRPAHQLFLSPWIRY